MKDTEEIVKEISRVEEERACVNISKPFSDCYYTVNINGRGANVTVNTGDEELMGRLIHVIKEVFLHEA